MRPDLLDQFCSSSCENKISSSPKKVAQNLSTINRYWIGTAQAYRFWCLCIHHIIKQDWETVLAAGMVLKKALSSWEIVFILPVSARSESRDILRGRRGGWTTAWSHIKAGDQCVLFLFSSFTLLFENVFIWNFKLDCSIVRIIILFVSI